MNVDIISGLIKVVIGGLGGNGVIMSFADCLLEERNTTTSTYYNDFIDCSACCGCGSVLGSALIG